MVSANLNGKMSGWMGACILLCVGAVLLPGLAYAQDFEAVERRLGEGVAAGELSLEQAALMLRALREQGGGGFDLGARIEEVSAQLREAVIRGDIPEDEAWAKWNEFKDREIAPRLKEAVEAGRMPEEEAQNVWRQIEMREKAVQLQVAVARGEISEEDARNQMAETEQRVQQEIREAHFQRVERDIDAAVQAEKITPEQAEKKLMAVRKELWPEEHEERCAEEEAREAEFHRIDRELDEAVRAGKMRPEEAEKKRAAARRELRPEECESPEVHFNRLGVRGEAFDKIWAALEGNGLSHDQIQGTLGAMIGIIHEMRETGKGFKLNPDLRHHLKDEVGLTDEQIESVMGLARRALQNLRNRPRR